MDKYCKNCGDEITPHQVFCSKCGVKLIIDDSPTNAKTSNETNENPNEKSKMKLSNLDFTKIKSSLNKKEVLDGAIAGGISFTLLVIFTTLIGLIFTKYINNQLSGFNLALSFFNLDELGYKLSAFDMMNFSLLNTYIIKLSAEGDMATFIFSLKLIIFFILPIASVYLSLYLLKKFKNKEKITYDYLISHGCTFGILNLFVIFFTSKNMNISFFGSFSMNFSYLYGLIIIPLLIILVAYISCMVMYKGQLNLTFLAFTKNLLPLYKKILALSIILAIPLLVSTLRSSFDLSFKGFIAIVFFMGLNLVLYLCLSLFGVPITISTDVDSSSRLLDFFVDGKFSFTSTLLYIIVIVGMVCLLYSYFNKLLKKDRDNYLKELGKITLTISLFNAIIAYVTRIKMSINLPGEAATNLTVGVSVIVAFIMTVIVCAVIGIVVKYAENYLDKYITMFGENKRKFQLIYVIVLLVMAFANMLFIPSSQSAKAYKPSKKDVIGYEKNKKEPEVVYDDIKGNQHFILNNNEFLIQYGDVLYTINMKNHDIKKLINFDNYADSYVMGDKILVENGGRLDVYSLKGKKLNKESIKTGNHYTITLDNKYIYSYDEKKLYTMKGEAKYRLEEDNFDELLPYKDTTVILTRDDVVLKYDMKTKKEEELSSQYIGTIFRSQNDIYYLVTNEEGNQKFVSVETGESLPFYDQPIIADDRSWCINYNGKDGHALYKRDKDGHYNIVLDFNEYISLDSYNGKAGVMLIRMNNVPYILDVNKVILHDIELEMWEGNDNE